MNKKYLFLLVVLVLVISFTGCTTTEVDTLYSLPQPQAEFTQLQDLINADIADGSEYSAPTAGTMSQTVQLQDLDGDGVDEALAFLRDEKQQPQICIYHESNGEFSKIMTIEGQGTGILRVEYADLDGDGRLEIMVTWKIGKDMRVLKAYSLVDWKSAVLLTANCKDFQIGDLNSNGKPQIIAIQEEELDRYINLYSADDEGEISKSSAKLSSTITDIERFRISSIADNVPAVFVEGTCESDDEEVKKYYLTDICVLREDELVNITSNSKTGESIAVRDYEVFSKDIDGDGTLDIPFSKKVPKQEKGETDYYIFDWYSFGMNGEQNYTCSTYHCYNDGWYIVIPQEMRKNFTVRRELNYTGERTVVLSNYNQYTDTIEDYMTVYTLTDENRRERATIGNRFILLDSPTVIYSATFNTIDDGIPSVEKVENAKSRFHLIVSEWNVGSF